MNNDLKRHRLLKILSEQFFKLDLGEASVWGIGFEELTKKLKCSKESLLQIASVLFAEDEIGYHNTNNVEGLYAKPKGAASYTSNKYKRLREQKIFERIKNWIQTLIPIVSLLITAFVVVKSETRYQKRLDELSTLKKEQVNLQLRMEEVIDHIQRLQRSDSIKTGKP